jgi:hypothetical protein
MRDQPIYGLLASNFSREWCLLTLQAIICSNLVHHILIFLLPQAVCAVRMEQVVRYTITSVGMQSLHRQQRTRYR